MHNTKTTTSPARRAPEERTPLRHIIHHEEADGTIPLPLRHPARTRRGSQGRTHR